MEKIEVDWKEAFFVLALLVTQGEVKEARKYISLMIQRPHYYTATTTTYDPEWHGQ